jgi:flagellin
MLERMTTLATQAANGTYSTSADSEGLTARKNIQLEVKQLGEEIDRIATATTYNGNHLIDGTNPSVRFQIGATKDEKLTLTLSKMTVSGILSVSTIASKMSAASTAASAVDTIKAGVDKVSSFRAKLGATQNRLEHTVNNLKVSNENLTSAESRIRDTDMAKEISAYTKNNILNQAAQSMLAQANQAPQGTLQLLG